MSSRAWRDRVGVGVTMLAWAILFGTPVSGQDAAGTPGAIESDPITCSWKTDKMAVHVAERFELTLTCGVIEISSIRVVADQSGLDPAVMELIPFEVVGGTRHRDIEAPPWRYFQYSYTLRLLEDEFFGRDLNIPSVQLTYTVQTSAAGGARGLAQLYVLPALPLHILSLVPTAASDIADASPETFGDIEARLFRANVELVAAGMFLAFAVVLAGLGVVHSVGRYRSHAPAATRPLTAGAVLQGCVQGTSRLKSEVADTGWTPALAARALAMMRIAGAVALGRPVAQTPVDQDAPVRDGQLALRRGRFKPKCTLISAPTTAAALARQIANGGGWQAAPDRRVMLEDILDSLRAFEAERYSRNGHADAATLDNALDRGADAVERLRKATLWPIQAAETLKATAARLRGTVWSR